MKYIILKVCGGMGNQLFQIANAHKLSIHNHRKLLICDENDSSRPTYWTTLFKQFNDNLISNEEYKRLEKKSKMYTWAVSRFDYKDIVLNPDIEMYCIKGYYQSYKYFDMHTFEPMLSFTPLKEPIEKNRVAVHIRRTDYLNNNFHKPMSLGYYYNALEKLSSMMDENEHVEIDIFSDDVEWCKDNFKYKHITPKYVELESDIDELYMMSNFTNIIIANSSFSWWAAYLNSKITKRIFCPKNWFNNGCHLNTKDLRPETWNIIDDDLPFKPVIFHKDVFNIISLGATCCMVQNIHDNVYNHLGPIFRQPDNATNFFDWLIIDFRFIVYLFENLMFNDYTFLCSDNFTFKDINASQQRLQGGWSNVYRKVEFKDKDAGPMISLHDVKKDNIEIPIEFIEKYKRRFERLYNKIKNNDTIHLTHCFDFQWLEPYFPLVREIEKIFESCKVINPSCKVTLHLFIHPKYHNNHMIEHYKFIDNVKLCFLKNKGFHADWKANNLTFDEFLI